MRLKPALTVDLAMSPICFGLMTVPGNPNSALIARLSSVWIPLKTIPKFVEVERLHAINAGNW